MIADKLSLISGRTWEFNRVERADNFINVSKNNSIIHSTVNLLPIIFIGIVIALNRGVK